MRKKIEELYQDLLFRDPGEEEISSWIAEAQAFIRRGVENSEERRRGWCTLLAAHRKIDVAVGNQDEGWLNLHTKQSLPNWGFLLRQIEPGDVVVDAGAHMGAFAVQAAVRGATVLAVEASAYNARLLSCTAKANKDLDIRVVHAAAWCDEAVLGFQDEGPHGAQSFVATTGPDLVRGVRLDSLPEDVSKVTCVKLDIEGAEPLAVRGMQKLLAQGVDVLYETNSFALNVFGFTVQDLQKSFADSGYLSYLLHEGELYKVREDGIQPAMVADHLASKRDVQARPPMSDQFLLSEMRRLQHLPGAEEHLQREKKINPELLKEL